MSRQQHSYHRVSHEEVEVLMAAARVERAKAVNRALRALFHWRRKDDAWLRGRAPALSFNPCR